MTKYIPSKDRALNLLDLAQAIEAIQPYLTRNETHRDAVALMHLLLTHYNPNDKMVRVPDSEILCGLIERLPNVPIPIDLNQPPSVFIHYD